MQSVLQLLLDMCTDPAAALERIPEGNGLTLTAGSNKGVSKKVWSPGKLSDYWCQLYSYASLLECCENFLSATKPSAPCLLCHPFGVLIHLALAGPHFCMVIRNGTGGFSIAT